MIRIGPAGWSYKDWQGIVYPATKPKGFQELTYISEFFDTVEINVTFYRPIPARTSESWLKKVEKNKRFKFTGKLWQGFTHDRNAGAEDERMFKDGYAPLLEARRLGATLMQLPWSFRNTGENRQYVARLQQRFQDYPLVLEVRHASSPSLLRIDQLCTCRPVKRFGWSGGIGKRTRFWFSPVMFLRVAGSILPHRVPDG